MPDTQDLPQIAEAKAQATPAPTAALVAEIVRFRLNETISDQTLVVFARATGPLVRACPGFLGRHLMRDSNGVWTDLVLWENLDAARAAALAVTADPAFAPFMAAIDVSSIEMSHQPVCWSMGG